MNKHALVLSPHFDDAIWSCGKFLKELRGNGFTVSVVTIFGGESDEYLENNAFNNTEERRNINDEVIKQMGFLPINLDEKELVIRNSISGLTFLKIPFYWIKENFQDFDKLQYDSIVKEINKLCNCETFDVVLSPWGFGNHPDHLFTHHLSKKIRAKKLYYYWDFPYHHYTFLKCLRCLNIQSTYPIMKKSVNLNERINMISKYKHQTQACFGSKDNLKNLLLSDSNEYYYIAN